MWDWLNGRRRSSRRRQISSRNINDNESNTDWPFRVNFFQSSSPDRFMQYRACNCDGQRPKCLQTFSCTDILHGQRLEDFSRECWLENHLHRFGSPEIQERLVFDYPVMDIPETETLDNSDDSVTGSDNNIDEIYDTSTLIERPQRRRLALEELFDPPDQTGIELVLETVSSYPPVVELPPYSQYPDEPPPTYEEAVGQADRRSLRSHHSSELAFMW